MINKNRNYRNEHSTRGGWGGGKREQNSRKSLMLLRYTLCYASVMPIIQYNQQLSKSYVCYTLTLPSYIRYLVI